LGQIAEASVFGVGFSGLHFSDKRLTAARETDELADEFRAERMSDFVSRNTAGRNHESRRYDMAEVDPTPEVDMAWD
jgi:hypothetical protein